MTRFDAARRTAVMSDLLRLVRGRPARLLPFEEVREGLQLSSLVDRGLREVPLGSIVGSLGRAREFNRAFLPRSESLRERWQRLEDLAESGEGFAPVDLYQVDEAYFVVDGHHRVSVARSLGAPTIEARVKEFRSPVEVTADDSLEDLLLRRALADFLAVTGLEPTHPDEYRASVVHGYERLLEHINVHRYFRGIDTGTEVTRAEGVASWRDSVYRPMVEQIRSSGIMTHFPKRTETDLYLFTMDHLHALRQRYGAHEVGPETAVRHLRFIRHVRRPLTSLVRRLLKRLRRHREQAPG